MSAATQLTEREADTLRHMLGINDPSKRDPEPYRNHYCARGDDVPRLERLASLGLVVRRPCAITADPTYVATEAGIAAAKRSHRTIRMPKARRVYHRFLELSDCIPDLTFKRFLTDPEFSETRGGA